jgi:hypothetical protein
VQLLLAFISFHLLIAIPESWDLGTMQCPLFDNSWKASEFENDNRAILAHFLCVRALLL